MLLLLAAVYLASQSTAILNGQTVQKFALDNQDNAWVLGDTRSAARVTKLDPAGNVLLTTDLPGISGAAITVDSEGAAYIAGVNSESANAVITKLNAPDGAIVYQSSLGAATPAAIAVDSSGSVYVTGTPGAAGTLNGLAATSGTYQTSRKGADVFVLKLNPAGDRIIYSTFLGGSQVAWVCTPPFDGIGSPFRCMDEYLPSPSNRASAIAVDDMGAAYVTGSSNLTDFPVTVTSSVGQSWLAKFDPSATTLVYCRNVPGGSALAVDAGGNAYVGGSKVSPDGTALLYSTRAAPVDLLVLDSLGNVTGTASSVLSRLDISGTVTYSFYLPAGVAGLGVAIDSNDNPVTLGGSVEAATDSSGNTSILRAGGALTRFKITRDVTPALYSLQNAAASTAASQLVPGEVVDLIGWNLGPGAPVVAQVDLTESANSPLPVSTGGVSVYFNGVAAPLVFAQIDKVRAIVPYEVAGAETVTASVEAGSIESNSISFPMADAEPRVFFKSTDFVAYGSPGSLVTVFATGAGLMNPPETDGGLGVAGSQPALPVSCSALPPAVGRQVAFAGSTPGLLAGVVEIHLQMPPVIANGGAQFQIQVGERLSTPFPIIIRSP